MKKYSLLVLMSLVCLCACSTGDGENQPTPTEATIVSPTAAPTAIPESEEELNLEAFDKLAWTELTCFTDEETSLRNSNLQNAGYLTYDEADSIYFVDMNIGGIFVSDWNGKNRRQLSQDAATALQVEGEWLYYTTAEGIKRIHMQSGEAEVIYDGTYGEFMLSGEKVYINGVINNQGGFYVMEPDGSNITLVRENDPQMVSYVVGDGFWLGTIAHENDISRFLEGHLFGFDEAENRLFYINSDSWYPLLAGNWLSTFDLNTASRHVWNLETDEEVDLEVYAQKAVSDGKNLYYVDSNEIGAYIYRWNGSKSEMIWQMDGVSTSSGDYLYLTPEALYYLPKVKVDKKYVHQLWYYDLETGEIGQVY